MPDVIRAIVAWILGAMVLGVAWTVVAFAWWWGSRSERFGGLGVFARSLLGTFGAGGTLAGLVLVGTGTEMWLGDPLGRWGGASMVFALWAALELLFRDGALVAALAERAQGRVAGRVYASWAVLVWVAAKGGLVLLGFVAIWAFLDI